MTNEKKSNDSIGKRLKLWRKSLGKTQEEFSKLSDVGIAILRKSELDASTPGGNTLLAFANTGLNIHWLLTGEGAMATSERNIEARPYMQRLIDLGLEMAELSDSACEDILIEMSLKVKHNLKIQQLDRSMDSIRKKHSDND